MEFKEFLQKLIALDLTQTTSEYEEELPEEIFTQFESFAPKPIAFDLDVDKHRWYEVATTVYQVGDIYFGIRGATQMYSESSSWDDLGVDWRVFEMKEVQTVTYEEI